MGRWFGTRDEWSDEVRGALRLAGRDRELRWLRRLDRDELDRLVADIEQELGTHASRDDLLEHAARAHFDAQARREARARRGAAPGPDAVVARSRVLGLIFERRYGVSLSDAIEQGIPADPASDAVNRRIESALRRLGIAFTFLGEGHWVYETPDAVIHLRHYASAGAVDVYSPVRPWEPDVTPPEALLRRNGASIGGAFWGVCTFEGAGDHLCACARLATGGLGPDALLYALNSVLAFVEDLDAEQAD